MKSIIMRADYVAARRAALRQAQGASSPVLAMIMRQCPSEVGSLFDLRRHPDR